MVVWINDSEIVKPIHNLCKEKDMHWAELDEDQYEQYIYEEFNHIKSEEDAETEATSTEELYETLDAMSLSKSEMDAEKANEYALELGHPVSVGSWHIPRRFSDVWHDLEVATMKRVLRSRGEGVT